MNEMNIFGIKTETTTKIEDTQKNITGEIDIRKPCTYEELTKNILRDKELINALNKGQCICLYKDDDMYWIDYPNLNNEIISQELFKDNDKLESIIFPQNCTIADKGFNNSSLKSVIFTNVTLGEEAFNNCASLQTIIFSCHSIIKYVEHTKPFNNCNIKEITFPFTVKENIIETIFENCGNPKIHKIGRIRR